MKSEREEIIESIRVRLKTYRESLIRRLDGYWPVEGVLNHVEEDDFSEMSAIRELRKTEAALAKIREGTFGLCERCHCALAGERLEIVPFAQVCVTCQLKGRRR